MKIVEKINGEHLKFISDIHYNHAGILKFGYPSRENWNDIVEMNRGLEQILTNEINSEDTLIDLGDMFWKISVPEALRILNKIKAKKFYKINGNHDSWNLWTKYPDITNFPTARGDIMDFVVGLDEKDYNCRGYCARKHFRHIRIRPERISGQGSCSRRPGPRDWSYCDGKRYHQWYIHRT